MSAADRLLAALAAALSARRFYPADHPRVREALDRLAAAAAGGETTLLELEGTVVVDGIPPEEPVPASLARALARCGVDLVRIRGDATREDLSRLVEFLATGGEEGTLALDGVVAGRAVLGGAAEGGEGPAAAPEAVARDRVAVTAEALAPVREGGVPDGRTCVEVVEALDRHAARAASARELLAPPEPEGAWHEVHAHNVAALTVLLGRALGLARPARLDLGLAALVHDVGMVGRPPEELAAAASEREELAADPGHPRAGLELLAGHPVLPPLAAVVAWEHHWPPGGRHGRRPHPAVRVVAVAEAADLALWAGKASPPGPASAAGLDPGTLHLLHLLWR